MDEETKNKKINLISNFFLQDAKSSSMLNTSFFFHCVEFKKLIDENVEFDDFLWDLFINILCSKFAHTTIKIIYHDLFILYLTNNDHDLTIEQIHNIVTCKQWGLVMDIYIKYRLIPKIYYDTCVKLCITSQVPHNIIYFINKGFVLNDSHLILLLNFSKRDKSLIHYIKVILDTKLIPSKTSFFTLCNSDIDKSYILTIIDLFINCGYILEYDDLVIMIKNKLELNSIEDYNISLNKDDTLIKVCAQTSFYPYNIKPTLQCLEIECDKRGNFTQIKKIIKSGIKPNIICLQNACKYQGNIKTIQYLINEHKIYPDIISIKNMLNADSHQDMVYAFEKGYEKHQQLLNNNNTDTLEIVNDTNKLEIINDNLFLMNNNKFNLQKIPIDYNYDKIHIINPKIQEIFECSTDEYLFIDFRKKVYKYIIKKNLINNNIIKLNTELQYFLPLTNTIELIDIDKFVWILINVI
jgi:hypothetical protein